MIFSKFIQKSC